MKTISSPLPNIAILDADPKISPVGYTDFERVWLGAALSGPDREIAMIHECSHIWLGHRDRSKAMQAKLASVSEPFDPHTWNLALDAEIAQHVYSKEQTEHIRSHAGLLRGGVVWPIDGVDAEFAEEIYGQLMAKNPNGTEGVGTPHVPAPQDKASAAPKASGEAADGAASAPGDQDGAASAPGDQDGAASAPGDQDGAAAAPSDPTSMTPKELRQAIRQIEERIGERLAKPLLKKARLASDIAALAQSAEKRIRSTSVASRRQLDKSLVLPGYRVSKHAPKVAIFVDRSGSFDHAKTAASLVQVTKLIARYGSKIQSEILYFGKGQMYKTDPLKGDGNTPYHLIYDHLKLTRPALAVIITDDDDCQPQAMLPTPVRVLCVGSRYSSVAKAWPMAIDLDGI